MKEMVRDRLKGFEMRQLVREEIRRRKRKIRSLHENLTNPRRQTPKRWEQLSIRPQ